MPGRRRTASAVTTETRQRRGGDHRGRRRVVEVRQNDPLLRRHAGHEAANQPVPSDDPQAFRPSARASRSR